jgi:catechol 2,3-dioxygenase-like lactoylglutathione lyase family enzyme
MRETWVTPEFDIVRAAYGEYVVTDLSQARDFYVGLLGLVVTDETPGVLWLRGYEERTHHSFVLRQGDVAHVSRMGFRVASEDDLHLPGSIDPHAHGEALSQQPRAAAPPWGPASSAPARSSAALAACRARSSSSVTTLLISPSSLSIRPR